MTRDACHGQVVESTFRAPWWLRSRHLQTVWPTFLRRGPWPVVRRERLELPDGDFVDLDAAGPPGGPTILVLTGLEGSSRSPYARGLMHAAATAGWQAVVMHFRGLGGERNRLDRSYHSGDTGDVDTVARVLGARAGEAPLAVVGFSLGGNVVLKWLGELGPAARVRAACAICVPLDLARSARQLERGVSRLYCDWLLRAMKRRLAVKFEGRVPSSVDPDAVARSRTMREFDEALTAPLHGFDGADDYYRRSSARQYLRHIEAPTLLVQARDDPFMTPEVIPGREELSPAVTLELSARGGHVGFVTGGVPWGTSYWLESRIVDFLAPHMRTRSPDEERG